MKVIRCRYIPVAEDNEESRDLAIGFPEYIESLPEDEQKKRLGSAKFGLWKSGDYKLNPFEYPRPGQRLSMAELRERDKALFRAEINFNPHGFMKLSAPISDQQIASIRRYTCGEDRMYRKINAYMQEGETAIKNAQLDKIIADIRTGIRVSTLNQEMVTYRGIRSEALFNSLKSGVREIFIDSFQSTSITRAVADGYAGHNKGESVLLVITLRQGTPCLDVSKISAAPSKEDEILLDATGKYDIKRVYYDKNGEQLIAEVVYER